jgi:hypothetical protein
MILYLPSPILTTIPPGDESELLHTPPNGTPNNGLALPTKMDLHGMNWACMYIGDWAVQGFPIMMPTHHTAFGLVNGRCGL